MNAKRTRRVVRRLHLLVIAALLAGLAFSVVPVAHAADITVDTLTDENDHDCNDGDCSLRDAIETASAGQEIDFSVTGTITLTSGELTIDKNLTITGPGADQLTVSGNNNDRVFDIHSGTVTISGLTIADGNGAGDGGGICNGADLTLTNCTVSGNTAGNDGGGIYNAEDLTLTNCTVSDNTAGYDGGGIYNDDFSDLTLTNCTVGDNTAGDDGGGIYNDEDMTMTLTNCTVSGNEAYDGGGIYNVDNLTLTNCTVSGNTAGNDGGGIYDDGDTYFKNTILANNAATDDGPDCYGGPDSYGYNLAEDTTDCNINQAANPGTNITGQDPNLGPLQDNGGPTFTHALLPGSPAIDAVLDCTTVAGDAVTQDQRGEPRPADGDQDGTAICDIGAYEVQPPPPPPVPVGGIVVPVNKVELLAPWLGLVVLVVAGGTLLLGVRKRKP